MFEVFFLLIDAGEKKEKILQRGVFYFWHKNILAGMLFFFKECQQGHCVVSPSVDGKTIGFVIKKLGFNVIYGSAYKEPVRLVRQSLSVLENQGRLCLVGDGSRGPAFKLQRGVWFLAKKAKVPLIFVDCHIEWSISFTKSWDQFQIPLPFSKVFVTVYQVSD